MVAQGGRTSSSLDYGGAGAESAMGKAVTGSAVGLQATLPIVQNNLRYADQFNNIANATSQLGDATNIYSGYKTALGLVNPDTGSEALGNTLSPGNMINTGGQYAWYTNPVTGVIQAINQLTADEENPFGEVPIVSNINEYVANQAGRLNETGVAQSIRSGLNTIYGNTIEPIMSSTPGRLAYTTGMVPVTAVETGFNALREAGEWVDRTLFGGYLPYLASDKEGKESTQRWDNPARPFMENINSYSDILASNSYADQTTTSPQDITSIPRTPTSSDSAYEGLDKEYVMGELNKLLEMVDLGAESAIDSVGTGYTGGELITTPGTTTTTPPVTSEQAEKARGDRFVDDPNNVSETGLGYTYVPTGFVFDPEVGLIRNYDEALGGDNNDYTYLSEQDRQVMNSINSKASRLERDKMFLDPTREQILKDSYLNEANNLRNNHNHMMKDRYYNLYYEGDYRKRNPEEKVGDYFLFNGADTQYATGREWNASSLGDFWRNDTNRQVNDAINYNFNTNFNSVAPGNTSYGTGNTATYYA